MNRKHIAWSVNLDVPWPSLAEGAGTLRRLLPTPGNALFTLLMIGALLWAASAGALPLRAPAAGTSTGTIAYQGRLADANGNPLTDTYNMLFRLYDAASGGTPLWEEQWTGSNGVKVSDGLFNVMLGSLTPIPTSLVTDHSSLFLGITVGTDDEMTPRLQLGSVPFAVQALTVPDGSVNTTKIADGAVTSAKLALNWLRVENPDASIWLGPDPNAVIEMRSRPGTAPYIDFSNDTTSDYDMRVQLWSDDWLNIVGGNVHVTDGVVKAHGSIGAFEAVGTMEPGIRLDNTNFTTWDIFSGGGGHPTFNNKLVFYNRDNGQYAGIAPDGSLFSTGSKSAIVSTSSYGQRKLYAAESPEVRFFDEGLAHLKDGIAQVTLDPVFLETIEGDYLVHVTPYGNASLYVAEIGKDYFVVKAREGDPNAAFAWRLSAQRKGYAGVRLEQVESP